MVVDDGTFHLYEVSFDGDRWLTGDQQRRMLQLLGPLVRTHVRPDVDRLMAWVHAVVLDVAAIGSVIAYDSLGYVNRFHRREGAGFSVKNDAGFPPEGVYAPAGRFSDEVAERVLERSLGDSAAEELAAWVHGRLADWWTFASLLAPGAQLAGVEDDGRPEVRPGTTAPEATDDVFGQFLVDVLHDDDAPTCRAVFTSDVVPYEVECPFAPDSLTGLCPMHAGVA